MQILASFTASLEHMEIFSIDDCYFDASHIAADALTDYGRQIKATVLQTTDLPVTVGLARTKTLTKIAAEIVKKFPEYKGW